MKVSITTEGDRSVGIPSMDIDLDFRGVTPEMIDNGFGADNRDQLREKLKEFFSELMDEPVGVVFEDECPNCWKRMVEGKCVSKSCISNMLDEDEEEEETFFILDLPNPYNVDGPWITVDVFDNKKEALDFCQKKFGADDEGNINLLTENN